MRTATDSVIVTKGPNESAHEHPGDQEECKAEILTDKLVFEILSQFFIFKFIWIFFNLELRGKLGKNRRFHPLAFYVMSCQTFPKGSSVVFLTEKTWKNQWDVCGGRIYLLILNQLSIWKVFLCVTEKLSWKKIFYFLIRVIQSRKNRRKMTESLFLRPAETLSCSHGVESGFWMGLSRYRNCHCINATDIIFSNFFSDIPDNFYASFYDPRQCA